MSAALEASVSDFSFGQNSVLAGVELRIERSETVAILGPSGCGKSTLVGVVAGLLPRQGLGRLDGDVRLFGESPARYRSEGKLSVMFQDPTLLPHLSVRENVALPLEILRRSALGEVDELLSLVGLSDFSGYLPRDLSGGMRTRVALARSFVSRPDILLLDEPFTGLDLGWKESLYGSLQDLRARFGTTVLMVTHDLEEAVYNSDRILVMSVDGRIQEEIGIEGGFPREFRFGETVSHHTSTLERLAALLTLHRTAGVA